MKGGGKEAGDFISPEIKSPAFSPYSTLYFTFDYMTSVSKSSWGSDPNVFERAHQAYLKRWSCVPNTHICK